jgi:hypothetical protein
MIEQPAITLIRSQLYGYFNQYWMSLPHAYQFTYKYIHVSCDERSCNAAESSVPVAMIDAAGVYCGLPCCTLSFYTYDIAHHGVLYSCSAQWCQTLPEHLARSRLHLRRVGNRQLHCNTLL